MINKDCGNKRTFVKPDLCISCGSCVIVDETHTFYMDDDGKANTKDNDAELIIPQAICPVNAIFIKTLNEYNKK
ncbi:ferredoxin [Spiroplasma endosymbiont of Amphibalanus improvisus]|uniref:ferredoxin n=1 Tax=Spiroplasma endosymbiont of Amphibalanus improvisus TaxID=3066327 RepID=UPI00313B5818